MLLQHRFHDGSKESSYNKPLIRPWCEFTVTFNCEEDCQIFGTKLPNSIGNS